MKEFSKNWLIGAAGCTLFFCSGSVLLALAGVPMMAYGCYRIGRYFGLE